MTYRTLAVSILFVFMTSACSRLAPRRGVDGENISERQATEKRARIIERLVPEDTLFREPDSSLWLKKRPR